MLVRNWQMDRETGVDRTECVPTCRVPGDEFHNLTDQGKEDEVGGAVVRAKDNRNAW